MAYKSHGYSFGAAVITAALVAFLLEIFLFNYQFFIPMNHEISSMQIEAGEGIQAGGQGYMFVKKEDGSEYDWHVLTIKNINDRVDNIYIWLVTEDTTNEISFMATDDSNSISYELGTRTYVAEVEASHYIRLNLTGNAGDITLKIRGTAGTTIPYNVITFNTRKPFVMSALRLLVVFLTLLVIICVYKNADMPYLSQAWYRYILIAAVICIQIIFFCKTAALNPDFTDPTWSWHTQYQDLAKSLLKGQLYVYDDAPECLKEMENPYDRYLRDSVVKANGTTYRWDTAFYNGKYYVYFGVIPAIIYYIPYYVITHNDLPNYMAVIYSAIIFILAAHGLISAFIRKYFKNATMLAYILVTTAVINGCGCILLVKRPDLYAVPIMAGVAFTVLGLYLWMEASDCPDTKRGRLCVAAGSLSMALVAGCRPQLVLASFCSLIIFGRYFVDKLKNKDKSVWKTVAAFAAPYVIIAAFLMWYNYARFGSVTDFGANYNLTTNDMTGRGFDAGRTGIAVFSYLFQTPHISAVFPFLNIAKYYTSYLGNDIWEYVYGGLITSNMFMWSIFFIRRAAKKCDKNQAVLIKLTVWLIISALIIVIADAQMAGILQRYFTDAGIFLVIASAVIWFIFVDSDWQNIKYMLLYAVLFTVIYNVLLIFITGSRGLNVGNTESYYNFYYLVQFWL